MSHRSHWSGATPMVRYWRFHRVPVAWEYGRAHHTRSAFLEHAQNAAGGPISAGCPFSSGQVKTVLQSK